MSPRTRSAPVGSRPLRLLAAALGALLILCLCLPADAQRKRRPKRKPANKTPAAEVAEKKEGKKREQVFDFTGLELQGSLRMPQLLYFLGRANEELERASLERRSFVPEMVRSVEEEDL